MSEVEVGKELEEIVEREPASASDMPEKGS